MFDLKTIHYNDQGLIPAVVQDMDSKRVLMVAWMNEESLMITLREKRTCFWSRSRKCLWRKGETSGHVQHVVSIETDCDEDTLLIQVHKDGPACHMGPDSCFDQHLVYEEGKEGY